MGAKVMRGILFLWSSRTLIIQSAANYFGMNTYLGFLGRCGLSIGQYAQYAAFHENKNMALAKHMMDHGSLVSNLAAS
jgi:hypothetical protein